MLLKLDTLLPNILHKIGSVLIENVIFNLAKLMGMPTNKKPLLYTLGTGVINSPLSFLSVWNIAVFKHNYNYLYCINTHKCAKKSVEAKIKCKVRIARKIKLQKKIFTITLI